MMQMRPNVQNNIKPLFVQVHVEWFGTIAPNNYCCLFGECLPVI